MKILQNTTDFSNKQVREIIDFVMPNNLPTSNFDVRVTHCSSGAYTGYSIPERARPTVVSKNTKPKNENIFPYYRDETSKVRRPYRHVTLYYEKFA